MFTAALFTIAKTWKQTKCPPTTKQKGCVCVCVCVCRVQTTSFAATWI